ncbi:hypothetical protein CYMTET_17241 [Cymbomonas tetramitiformis]|uniref:SET domain-containing protein n=1 Tax=Cymbomonas tetramitiformis TaxID=36881 RepID=A0AAE0GBX2_9CHLO|nr:hypothetical protein CYMTET_17241 [Cymbomonas tetramitiformis]
MVDWIRKSGGFVSSKLAVAQVAPYTGTRGIIVKDSVREGETLFAVPIEACYMSSSQACDQLGIAAARKLSPPMASTLPPQLCLAMLLAHERSKGKRSKWYAYIHSLPEDIPCAWAMSEAEAMHSVKKINHTEAKRLLELRSVVASCLEEDLQRAKQLYGPPFGAAGVDNDSILRWALGMVFSRSYAGESIMALGPLVDMCNHADQAHAPFPGDFNGVQVTAVSAAEALAVGDELCVSYSTQMTEELTWLNYGFLGQASPSLPKHLGTSTAELLLSQT